MPEIGMILREGKGKKIYATDDPDKAIVYFKDEAMAFHGLKRGRILGTAKSTIRCANTCFICWEKTESKTILSSALTHATA